MGVSMPQYLYLFESLMEQAASERMPKKVKAESDEKAWAEARAKYGEGGLLFKQVHRKVTSRESHVVTVRHPDEMVDK